MVREQNGTAALTLHLLCVWWTPLTQDCITYHNGTEVPFVGSQCGNEDNIRMTMYYYGGNFTNGHGGYSGHFNYNYTGAWGIGAPGIEGGS